MSTEWMDIAVNRHLLIGIGPFVAGIFIVAMLIGAVWLGRRVRRSEPPPPRPEEQPHLPDGGAVHEELVGREPDELVKSRYRFTPHQLKSFGNMGSRPVPSKPRRRWSRGSSGSFGGGGLGSH
ncbi:DUF6479 family protein [Streptomyces sp. NPDC002845]